MPTPKKTGWRINKGLIKVSDDGNNYRLDVNNRRVDGLFPSGLPQAKMPNPEYASNYRVYDPSYCQPDTAIFYNDEQFGWATKNDCPSGNYSNPVRYVVAAGVHQSSTKEAANALALNDVNENKQGWANEQGECIPNGEFGNEYRSGSFVKNDCPEGFSGSTELYEVPVNTFFAPTQIEANNEAEADVATQGQAFANSQGECVADPVFGNQYRSQLFTRNNCGVGSTGTEVNYEVLPNTFTASTQDGANALAEANIAAEGQNFANVNGGCIADVNYYLVTGTYGLSGIDSATSCTAGVETESLYTTNPDGKVGVDDCFYKSDGAGGYLPFAIYPAIVGGDPTWYWISYDEDGNRVWVKIGYDSGGGDVPGDVIFEKGFCSFVANRSSDFQKDNCVGAGQTGSFVTFSKNYFSAISQEDADQLAISDPNYNSEGQANANALGECFEPLPTGAVGIVVIDLYQAVDACAFVDTPTVFPHQMPVYRGNNFLPNDGTPPENCWALASDEVNAAGVRRRFEFNVARLLNTYPAITDFTFRVRGRGAGAGTMNGAYSLKGADAGNMIMTGSAGNYIPSVVSASDLGVMGFSGKPFSGGANGQIGVAFGTDILVFNYNVATNNLTLL